MLNFVCCSSLRPVCLAIPLVIRTTIVFLVIAITTGKTTVAMTRKTTVAMTRKTTVVMTRKITVVMTRNFLS
jgi:hypothetical protein